MKNEKREPTGLETEERRKERDDGQCLILGYMFRSTLFLFLLFVLTARSFAPGRVYLFFFFFFFWIPCGDRGGGSNY